MIHANPFSSLFWMFLTNTNPLDSNNLLISSVFSTKHRRFFLCPVEMINTKRKLMSQKPPGNFNTFWLFRIARLVWFDGKFCANWGVIYKSSFLICWFFKGQQHLTEFQGETADLVRNFVEGCRLWRPTLGGWVETSWGFFSHMARMAPQTIEGSWDLDDFFPPKKIHLYAIFGHPKNSKFQTSLCPTGALRWRDGHVKDQVRLMVWTFSLLKLFFGENDETENESQRRIVQR